MNQEELVLKAKSGDKDAFCRLYTLYKDALYRYAFYRLGNTADAEDAVSDAIVSAFSQIKRLKKPVAFEAWLFRILYCSCTAIVKCQIRQGNTANIEEITDLSCTDKDTTALQESLGILTNDEREIVLLSIIAGLKSREIAPIVGLTAGSVRSKLSRSLRKMKNFLE